MRSGGRRATAIRGSLGLVAAAVLVLGCNGHINPEWFTGGRTGGPTPVYAATVQAFHRLPLGDSVTYAFLPLTNQRGDLEYETYVDMARKELAARGWREVEQGEARVFVTMDYLLDEGTPYRVEIPLVGQTGVSGARTSGHVSAYRGYANYATTTTYTPRFGITGVMTRSYDQYRRCLYVMAFDTHEQVDGKPRTVFQGKGISVGTTPHLSPVMPFLTRWVIGQLGDESGAIREYRSDR